MWMKGQHYISSSALLSHVCYSIMSSWYINHSYIGKALSDFDSLEGVGGGGGGGGAGSEVLGIQSLKLYFNVYFCAFSLLYNSYLDGSHCYDEICCFFRYVIIITKR